MFRVHGASAQRILDGCRLLFNSTQAHAITSCERRVSIFLHILLSFSPYFRPSVLLKIRERFSNPIYYRVGINFRNFRNQNIEVSLVQPLVSLSGNFISP